LFDNKNGQIGATIGKPKGNGVKGTVTEEFICINPNEKLQVSKFKKRHTCLNIQILTCLARLLLFLWAQRRRSDENA